MNDPNPIHGSGETPAQPPSDAANSGPVLDALRETQRAVTLAGKSARSSALLLLGLAGEQLRERPYLTLSVAGGVGFIVAGGLSAPAARGLVGVGSRLVVATAVGMVTEVIADALRADAGADAETADAEGVAAQSPRSRRDGQPEVGTAPHKNGTASADAAAQSVAIPPTPEER